MATSRFAPFSRITSLHVYCSTVRPFLASCADAAVRMPPVINATPMPIVMLLLILMFHLSLHLLRNSRPMQCVPSLLKVMAPNVPGSSFDADDEILAPRPLNDMAAFDPINLL